MPLCRNRQDRRIEKDLYHRASGTNCIQITGVSQIAYVIIPAILIVKERCGNVRELVKSKGSTNNWKYSYPYLFTPAVCCISKIAVYLNLLY